MTTSSNALNFFTLEASECLERMDAALARTDETEVIFAAFLPAARQLRGSSVMYRLRGMAELAGAVERIGRRLAVGTLAWSPAVSSVLVGAVDALKSLLRAVRAWGPAEDARVGAAVAELNELATVSTERIVPITELAPDDGEPQLVRTRPTTPTGPALRAVLEVGISELSQLADHPLVDAPRQRREIVTPTVRVTRDHPGAGGGGGGRGREGRHGGGVGGGVVPMESLLYDGSAALERARALRDRLRRAVPGSPGTREALDELFDLLDLAAPAT